MDIRVLAEAIILQSLEDLNDPAHRPECLEFFHGWRFETCSVLAGLSTDNVSQLKDMVENQKTLKTLPSALRHRADSSARMRLRSVLRLAASSVHETL